MVRLCFITVNLLCDIAILVYGQSTVSDCPTGTDRNHGLDPNMQQSDVVWQNLLMKIEKIDEKLQYVIQEVKDIRKMQVKACPSGFDFLPEINGCFKVILKRLSWSEARVACRGVKPGVHLVAITSAAKQTAIENYLKREFEKTESSACYVPLSNVGGKSVWIGGQRQNSAGCDPRFVWKTLDSTEIPFNYSNWFAGEPNCQLGDEHCVHVSSGVNYTWNDSTCYFPHCPFCEF